MPNSITEAYRKYLASTGQSDDRSDYEITAELGQWASQNNPNLFDAHPDFGQEFGAIRDANAPSLPQEFGRALKSGTQGLASTALGGLALLTDSGYLRDKALSFDKDAQENAPTIGTLEDIAPGRRGVGSLFSRDAARYSLSKLGSVAPSIGEAVVTAGVGAALGSAVAPGPGTVAGAAEGVVARGLIKSAIQSLLKKGAAEALVERGVIGEATEAALEQAVKQSIPSVTDIVGREAMAIGAKRGLATANLANSFLLNAGDVYSEGADRPTSIGLGLVSAIPDSILPTYVIGRLFPGVEKTAARKLAKSYVADRAEKALKAAGIVGIEALTEYFQEGVNVVARNLKEGKDALTFTPADMRRFREAGIAGAFGGVLAAPSEFITPSTTALPAAPPPPAELGAMGNAFTQAGADVAQQGRDEAARVAAEADAARQTEAVQLLSEQQSAINQGLSAQDAAAQQAAQAAEADAAATQQTALSMVGETPELAAQREADAAARNMVGAKPVDLTDPAQALQRTAVQMAGPAVGGEIISAYAQLPASLGGRYISTDLARTLVPGYENTNPTATNAQASAIASQAFEAGLANPDVDRVTLMAGGAGSGKSTAKQFTTPGELVYDGVFGSQESLKRLDQAVQSGKPVRVLFVYRPVAQAVNGMLTRKTDQTPVVPADVLVNGHLNSAQNFVNAAAKYADNPNVDFLLIDNSGAKGDAHLVDNPVEFLQSVIEKTPPREILLQETRSNPAAQSLPEAEKAVFMADALAQDGGAGIESAPDGQVVAGLPAETVAKVAVTPAPVQDAVVPDGKAKSAFTPKPRKGAQTITPPLAPRETITPRNDAPAGTNSAGESLFERADGSRYRMQQGQPNFGGDLASIETPIEPAPRSAEQRLNDAGLDLPPISSMSREAKRAELDSAGITTYNGKPLDAANPAEISNAVGKLRRGELSAEGPALRTASPASTSLDATKVAQFNAAVASLQQIGGNIQAFSQEMLAQNTAQIINQRVAALQQEQTNSQDPVVKQELGRRIAVLQERAAVVNQAQGVTYSPWHIALAMDDIGNANANNLVTLLHEAAESLTMRLAPEQQGEISNAINAALDTIRARAAQASEQTGVPLATETSPEDLLAETLAQEMAARGIPESPSLAQAIVRWIKDAYYRTAMAMQAAFGAAPDPSTALAWFENQLRREVSGDYSYAFSNLLDKYLPSPMKERVRRFDGRTGTPGGIPDFVDPVSGTGTQPQVETLNRDSLNWNMQFRQAGNPGEELDIPDPEARARIKGAMLNGLAEFYETLRGQVAPDMPAAEFFQQIKRVGEENPALLLQDLEQKFQGAGTAKIGDERMTDPMNREAQIELWSRLRKFGLSIRRQSAQLQKAVTDGTSLLSSTASTINRLEADLRNAAMHEDLLKLSAKSLVSELARGFARGTSTAQLEGALAENIREEERLLSTDPIPEQYQQVLQSLYSGGLPVFDYMRAIAELDLPLEEMAARDVIKAIRANTAGSAELARLTQNKPLTVALATLAKKNADQMDQIQLGWLRDMPRFKEIHSQLEEIKGATTSQLRDITAEMNERGKAAGLAARLKASYLAKRRRQQALSERLARSEDRQTLLDKIVAPVEERTALAAQDAGGAQYEWTPEEGATWTAMQQGDDGAWRRTTRTLRYNPDGSAVDGDQLKADIANNFQWLREHAEDAGKPRYNQIAAQTYALKLLDARGQQQRTWNVGILSWLPRAIDRFVRTPTAFARTLGGPAMQRVIQMLHKYQFVLRSYTRTLEVPAAEWQYEFRRMRDTAGLKDNAEFMAQVYRPAMYFIATNPGLEEGAAIRQAATLVRRGLPAPREDFNERFATFMRKTKEAETKLLDIAEQYGVFVADKRLGPELRRAVARGYLTGMRSLNGGMVDVVTKDMQQAGWKLAYNEEERNGKMVKTDIRPDTFSALDPANAADPEARAAVFTSLANDQALRPLLEKLFTPSIIGQWLEPFIRKSGQEPFAYKGEPIPQALVQEAWNESGGDVLTWIDRLGLKLGVKPDKEQNNPAALFRLTMLRNLDQLFGHEARLAADASQTPGLLDPHGPKPHALMDARVSDLLPAEHVEFATYEPESMHRLVARVAYHGAFGRNAKNIQAAFRETMNYLKGKQSQWNTLVSLYSTNAGREAEAKRRGWDYDELKNVSKRYEETKNFKTQLEAVLGVSADSGPLGDFHKGMAIMSFVSGQIVDNPKTAAYNLLSPAMRPFVQRSLGPTAISNTVRAYGDILQTGLGSVFQSFGLNLFKAGRYADTIGNAEGRAFSNLPYGVVMADIGHSGDNQEGANKWMVKPLKIARNLQRKGVQIGAGTATEFPRLSVIPGLGVINTLSQIETQASGARLAQELEQIVRDGIDYMAAHPEAANNPAFRFKGTDLFGRFDQGMFDWWQQKTVEYNLGNLEDVVRDAAKRQTDEPKARLLTDDQALIVSMMNHNEMSGNSSVNTTPGWLMTNRFFQMAMPLMRWPLWMMSAVHEASKPRAGENAVKPMLRAMGTLALWNLPIGLAFSLLMDEYDKRLLGKKSNLPNLDKRAAIPLIGLPLSLATSDKPLSQLESMLVRSARAGNIYGLGADVAASTLAGLDPSTGQRAFSLDQRVLAFSQLANIGQAILNWKAQEGQATWGSVARPVLMAVGGNGALHSVDIANHLLGLDNAQSRLTERAAAANWIRSSAQELDIEVKKGAFGSTPTPLSANTREMYLAALANDRADFLESYKRALNAARARVAQDPDVPFANREREAVNRVLSSWRSRNPMAVLTNKPTDAEIARILSIMEPVGQESVRTALARFKSFSDLIEPSPLDRYMHRQMSTQQRAMDPNALRRRMSSGSLLFSTR